MKSLETVTDWILFIGGIITVISFCMALYQTDAYLNLHGNPWK